MSPLSRLFHDDSWRDLLEKPEPTKSEIAELVGRVSQYMSMSSISQLNIAEAMVTYQDKVTDEDTCQVFVPFLSDVRLGAFSELESEEPSLNSSYGHCNSLFKSERNSPPSSPNISKHSLDKELSHKQRDEEYMELQLDYWFVPCQGEAGTKNEKAGTKPDGWERENSKKQDSEKSKKQTDLKSSIKTQFRNLSVSQLSHSHLHSSNPAENQYAFAMTYTTKEKKPKAVLKIGKKKDKAGDTDSKFQSIDGINRLICMTKNHPLKVAIDSQEWNGVKFFQVSSQWQTHIKYLPVCVGTLSS